MSHDGTVMCIPKVYRVPIRHTLQYEGFEGMKSGRGGPSPWGAEIGFLDKRVPEGVPGEGGG